MTKRKKTVGTEEELNLEKSGVPCLEHARITERRISSCFQGYC